MNRNPKRTLGLVAVSIILSFALVGGGPAPAQQTPPPPRPSRRR